MGSGLLLLAAFASGAGGLGFELACLRRTALVLGWGGVGQALVFGAFLVGFGVGAKLAPWVARGRDALRCAVLLQLFVALGIPIADRVLAGIVGVDSTLAMLVCFGLPFALMAAAGAAVALLFPVLTARSAGRGSGLLQACNLCGSCVAAFAIGGFAVPMLGLSASALTAAGCYALAAVLLWCSGKAGRLAPSRGGLPRIDALRLIALGFALLGLQIWLPRRLQFILGSFLPTIAGSIVAVLLGMSLGGLVLEWLARRGRRPDFRSAAAASFAAICASVLLVELLGPSFAGAVPHAHAEAVGLAVAVPALLALPATLSLGMLLPLVLDALAGPRGLTLARSGDAQLALAIGAGLGLAILPGCWGLPSARLWLPAIAATPLAIVAMRPLATLVGVAALAAAVIGFGARPTLEGARWWPQGQQRKLVLHERADAVTTASVVFDRVVGERLLYTDEFSAAGGVSSSYMRALGLLPARFAPANGERVLICLGTGTTAASFAQLASPITIVELSRAVCELGPRFVENHARWHERSRVVVADGRHYVESRPAGSLGALTLEPLLPQAPGSVHLYSRGFYRAFVRAAVPGACCVQWLPTHGLDPAAYRSLLRSFFAEFSHARAWLVDHSTLLVGSVDKLEEGEVAAGLDAYLCGLWSDEDWAACELDSALARRRLGDGEHIVDDRPLLETRLYAPGAAILSWLPQNLELWLDRDETGVERRASRHRLEAKIAAARSHTTSLESAITRLEQAVAAAPSSLLLRREHTQLLSQLNERRGRRALLLQNWSEALRAFERALRGVAARPRVLAGRVIALWGLEERKRALRAVDELRAYLPGFAALPELKTREYDGLRSVAPIAARIAGAAAEDSPDPSDNNEGTAGDSERRSWRQQAEQELLRSPFDPDSAAAWARGEAWARRLLLRRPYAMAWQIVAALSAGRIEPEASRLDALLRELELPLLTQLEGWVRAAPAERLSRLAALRRGPRPEWWRQIARDFRRVESLPSEPSAEVLSAAREAWKRLAERCGFEQADRDFDALRNAQRLLPRSRALRIRFVGQTY